MGHCVFEFVLYKHLYLYVMFMTFSGVLARGTCPSKRIHSKDTKAT